MSAVPKADKGLTVGWAVPLLRHPLRGSSIRTAGRVRCADRYRRFRCLASWCRAVAGMASGFDVATGIERASIPVVRQIFIASCRCEVLHVFHRETEQLGNLHDADPAQQTMHNLHLTFFQTPFQTFFFTFSPTFLLTFFLAFFFATFEADGGGSPACSCSRGIPARLRPAVPASGARYR